MTSRRASALVLAVFSPLSLLFPQQRPLGRLLGVFDDATGQPIAGAEAIDLSTGTITVTSVTGTLSLAWLGTGTNLLQVRKIGYASKTIAVVVSAADTVSITLLLRPLGQSLPAVLSTATSASARKLADFELRRKIGIGQFITQDQLDRNSDRQLSGIMQLIAGPRIVHSKVGGAAWIVGGRGQGSLLRSCPNLDRYDLARGAGCACYAAVFVDGAQVYGGGEGEMLFDINSVSPREVAGIEFYNGPASMPAQFAGTRLTCGAVVIWTR